MMETRQYGPWKCDKTTTVGCEVEVYRSKVRLLYRPVSVVLKGTERLVVAVQRHIYSGRNLKQDIEGNDIVGILSTNRVSHGRQTFGVNVHGCILAS